MAAEETAGEDLTETTFRLLETFVEDGPYVWLQAFAAAEQPAEVAALTTQLLAALLEAEAERRGWTRTQVLRQMRCDVAGDRLARRENGSGPGGRLLW